MGKTKFILIIILIVIAIVMAICYLKNFNKTTEENFTENESFKKIIQYRTESVNDDTNIDNILKNIEFGKYISRVEKDLDGGKEQLTIYYDCTVEAEVKEYWKNANKNSIIEKNSVILFSLIDKLDRVRYIFSVSDNELVENYQYLSEKITKEYDRESINLKYNQDVRNYTSNPSEFLNYSIDTELTHITIYKLEYDSGDLKLKKIEIDNEKQVNDIKKIIDNQNFGIQDYATDGMIEILIDLNNGYIMGLYAGDSNDGIIFKGTIEEYLNEENILKKTVSKILPTGLKQYINDIITDV